MARLAQVGKMESQWVFYEHFSQFLAFHALLRQLCILENHSNYPAHMTYGICTLSTHEKWDIKPPHRKIMSFDQIQSALCCVCIKSIYALLSHMQQGEGGWKFFLNQINFHSHLERGEIEVDLRGSSVCVMRSTRRNFKFKWTCMNVKSSSQESEEWWKTAPKRRLVHFLQQIHTAQWNSFRHSRKLQDVKNPI